MGRLLVMAAGRTPQVSVSATCLPEATGEMSASVRPCLSSQLCQHRFPSGSYDLRHPDSASGFSAPLTTSTHSTTNTRSRCLSCLAAWLWEQKCTSTTLLAVTAAVSPWLRCVSDHCYSSFWYLFSWIMHNSCVIALIWAHMFGGHM